MLNVCGRHRFRVEIDGIASLGFREVESVCVSIEVQDFREGTDISSISRTGPAVVYYGPLVLRNAMTGNAGN